MRDLLGGMRASPGRGTGGEPRELRRFGNQPANRGVETLNSEL